MKRIDERSKTCRILNGGRCGYVQTSSCLDQTHRLAQEVICRRDDRAEFLLQINHPEGAAGGIKTLRRTSLGHASIAALVRFLAD